MVPHDTIPTDRSVSAPGEARKAGDPGVRMRKLSTGSEILLESLHHEKVEVIFGLPGGAVLPLYDALYSAGVHHLLVRHEQAAAFAADGYARAKGKPGVLLVTSGPGATNVMTGLTSALM